MTAEYTVPALRDTANGLRSKAAALIAAKDIEARQLVEDARRDAEAMRASAAEIDAVADSQELAQQQGNGQAAPSIPQPIGPCSACGQQLVRDELGNAHADRTAAEQCTGPNPPVPAPPTAPFEAVDTTRTEGEVAKP